jgi:ankyrin repeat protein
MQDVYGNTPLIQACQRGHIETARVLLDHGAARDHCNKVNSLMLTE